jgi:hypothetical protein
MLTIKQITASSKPLHNAKAAWILASLVLVTAAAYGLGNRTFRQGCDDEEGLAPQWQSFHHNEGFEQTDEYTPAGDDNDAMKIRLPAAWMAEDTQNRPNSGDGSFPAGTPLPSATFVHPDNFTVTANATHADDVLLIRLRLFHGWHILLDGIEQTTLPQRPDGLVAIPLHTLGLHHVEARYRKPWDQWAGGALSLLGFLCVLTVGMRESRTASVESKS